MKPTEADGVLFFEGRPASAKVIKPASVVLGGSLRSSQLLGLDAVKSALARKAKSSGGNAIVGFAYGQRSSSMVGSVLSLDDVVWYGKGEVASVETHPQVVQKVSSASDIIIECLCPKCDTVNEVPFAYDGPSPKCTQCHSRLPDTRVPSGRIQSPAAPQPGVAQLNVERIKTARGQNIDDPDAVFASGAVKVRAAGLEVRTGSERLLWKCRLDELTSLDVDPKIKWGWLMAGFVLAAMALGIALLLSKAALFGWLAGFVASLLLSLCALGCISCSYPHCDVRVTRAGGEKSPLVDMTLEEYGRLAGYLRQCRDIPVSTHFADRSEIDSRDLELITVLSGFGLFLLCFFALCIYFKKA